MSLHDGPSEHLTWKELACKNGVEYPKEWRRTRGIELAELFEFIRKEVGDKPIPILSAYRTAEYNKAVGGARNSMHIQGRALDLRPPRGMAVGELYLIIHNWAKVIHIGGLGRYKTFVHVDTRPGNLLVTWNGSGVMERA